jgi:hypothetical protein
MSQGREREIEGITPLAYFPTELLSEERLDIRLVIDNQHPYGHDTGPRTIWRHAWAVGFVAMFPLTGQNATCRLPAGSDAKPGRGLGPNLSRTARLTGWY